MQEFPGLKKLKLKKWELRKSILQIILLGILSGGGSWRKPTLSMLIEAVIEFFKEEKRLLVEEKKVLRALENFEKQDILAFSEKGEDILVTLNKENPEVIRYNIQLLLDYKIKKKEWIGKWYLVFFDVPEIQRNKRNQLRRFLEKLGFYRYQKSVYLLPYDCEEEIGLIKKIVEGAKYMKYIVAEKIEDEDKIKTFFNLT